MVILQDSQNGSTLGGFAPVNIEEVSLDPEEVWPNVNPLRFTSRKNSLFACSDGGDEPGDASHPIADT
ncbi:hypothetical protein PWG15_24590 (plasmid) [Ensifer adhaerens]|uniref:hypothetical protein n=1 Tax=Ensifer adhaerens TaxID=106592 RepID=UPI0023A9F7F1|nr:hypothetical protein [Ensifer adhaerens]WDZ80933.1 hypothetical protein PWG15_24590 [Ensifer adhaerens]